MDRLQQLAHPVLRGDELALQGAQGLACGRDRRVPEHVGEEAGDEVLPLPLKNSPLLEVPGRVSPVIQPTTAATWLSASGEAMSIQSRTLTPHDLGACLGNGGEAGSELRHLRGQDPTVWLSDWPVPA